MFNFSYDKHYVAMLAVPIILSMIGVFPGDISANDIDSSDTREQIEITSTYEKRIRGRSTPMSDSVLSDTLSPTREAIIRAVVAGNYEEFLNAMKETVYGEIMTEDAFSELQRQYQIYMRHT